MTTDAFIPAASRELIHDLNQRYRAQWDRAERLQAELNDIKNSRAWIIFRWLRALRRLSLPSPPWGEGSGVRGSPMGSSFAPAKRPRREVCYVR